MLLLLEVLAVCTYMEGQQDSVVLAVLHDISAGSTTSMHLPGDALLCQHIPQEVQAAAEARPAL